MKRNDHWKWLIALPLAGVVFASYTLVEFVSRITLPNIVDDISVAPISTAARSNPDSVPLHSNTLVSVPRSASPATGVPGSIRRAATNEETVAAPGPEDMTREAIRQATLDQDPARRASAIQTLASANNAEARLALSESLRDEQSTNRYLTLDSIRTMAWNTGDPDGTLRTLVSSATHDPDPDVADHARSILDEFTSLTQ